jgi:hypothetical protein
MGFVVDGTEKLTYNHCDSYPGWLGTRTLAWLRTLTGPKLGEARDKVKAIVLVDEETPLTPEQKQAMARFANPTVGAQGITNTEVHDWYQLLRGAQGDWQAYLDCGYMIDGHNFALDSLFCEWAYIVDFDKAVLEVYRGFQEAKHSDGRFADREPYLPEHRATRGVEYWPIRLIQTYSLERLPTDEQLCSDCDPPEDDE